MSNFLFSRELLKSLAGFDEPPPTLLDFYSGNIARQLDQEYANAGIDADLNTVINNFIASPAFQNMVSSVIYFRLQATEQRAMNRPESIRERITEAVQQLEAQGILPAPPADGDAPTPAFSVAESGESPNMVFTFENATQPVVLTVDGEGNIVFTDNGGAGTEVNTQLALSDVANEGVPQVSVTLDTAMTLNFLNKVQGYNLTDNPAEFTDLTVAEASVLEGANNAANYSYTVTNGSFADADGIVFTNATSVSLSSSPGSHVITGSPGDDKFTVDFGAGHATTLNIDGGEGTDILAFFNGAGTVNLTDAHFENISNMEYLQAASSSKENSISLGANADAAFGNNLHVSFDEVNQLDNRLILNASAMENDITVTGGNLNDEITAGSGTNVIAGGKGADTITLAENAGTDTIVIGGGETQFLASDTLSMTGLAADDSINVKINDITYTFTWNGSAWNDDNDAEAAGFMLEIDSSTPETTEVTVNSATSFTLNSVDGAIADDGTATPATPSGAANDETAALEVLIPSDSFATPGEMDIITNFEINGTDKLQLGYGVEVLDNGTYEDITAITDVIGGIVSFDSGITTLEAKLTAVFTALADSTNTAAFVYGSDTYVVQGDGAMGMQDSDIAVQLAGIDDLSSIDLNNILI